MDFVLWFSVNLPVSRTSEFHSCCDIKSSLIISYYIIKTAFRHNLIRYK
ncbi:hypothetical protein DXA95_13460 [Odoribacter sp. OF09-27XD]|nr:hypothetical protein DXA95_13460 [Odoribacter sp. OF09-27XD]HBO26329.1 hypothetical protein [Culturomica sp.]